MSDDLEKFLTIEISVNAANPEFLLGLDEWLRLGLIGDDRVKILCRRYLTCQLPVIQKKEQLLIRKKTTHKEEVSIKNVRVRPNILVQVWQSFLDELSIRWLLFLGIFLVVVSSGVLAASQWDNFPVVGQYLILWGYTLSFWLIGWWLSQQNNLQLTSQTLKNIAVLLVPINFWAMSSFGLINNILGWATIAIAIISLTAISYGQYRNKSLFNRICFLPLFLSLSYLHLGWGIINFAIWAVYAGIIAIALSSYYFLIVRQADYQISNLLFLLTTWALLLVRALFISQVGKNLALAIAIAGWLLSVIYLHREQQVKTTENTDQRQEHNIAIINRTVQPITRISLWFSWFISLVNSLFWQTTAINILGWHLGWKRLNLYWRKRDLLIIFIIGLQGIFWAKELIPLSLRKNALSLSAEITKTSYFPESVFGVTLFPYLLLFVAISTWLYRREKKQLAIFSEWLTFLLGLSLTWLSLTNPTWRSLNLLLSTLTLGYVSYIRQPIRRSLIYLTHALGLITIANAIALVFPNLNLTSWAMVCLLLMVAEWTIFIILSRRYKKVGKQGNRGVGE